LKSPPFHRLDPLSGFGPRSNKDKNIMMRPGNKYKYYFHNLNDNDPRRRTTIEYKFELIKVKNLQGFEPLA